MQFLFQHRRVHLAQRRIIVKDEEASSKRTAHQVTFTFLDFEIPKRDCRNATSQLDPLLASINGEKDPVLGPGKQEVTVVMVLNN